MTSTRSLVLDIHCFFNNSLQYIVKEMAVYDLNHHSGQHWIFKAPKNLDIYNAKARRANKWLTANSHGIHWEDGEVNYEDLSRILNRIASSYDIVYVKGQQKILFIESQIGNSICPQFVNVESMGCPKFSILLEPLCIGYNCISHNQSDPRYCTIYKTRAIVRWLLSF